MARFRLAIHRARFLARWQERNDGSYRLLCGSPRNCRGELGWTGRPESGTVFEDRLGLVNWSIDHIAAFKRAMGERYDLADCWVVTHPFGFYQDEDGHYRLIKNGYWPEKGSKRRSLHAGPVGRRPIPPALREAFSDPRESYDIIGRFPVLPTIIVCPVCDHPNEIDSPP